MKRLAIAFVAAAAVLTASVGCGGDSTTAGEDVPELRTLLASVDSALAEGEYEEARKAIDVLIRETIAAHGAGELSSDQADEILAAATRLAADLPEQRPTPDPRASDASQDDEGDDDEGDDDEGDDGEGDDGGEGKKKGKKGDDD